MLKYILVVFIAFVGVYMQRQTQPNHTLYEIQLPVLDNLGMSTDTARVSFEDALLEIAGGFSRPESPVVGYWKNPTTSEVFIERMIPYHIAGDETKWKRIVREAQKLFPDQYAFFTARIGYAEII